MIGPVMIGPSSSHTAGVVRIGRVARQLLCDTPREAIITFYNSFARTYEGHGSDRAVVAGLLDMHTDDERIRNSFDFAKEAGVGISFKAVGNASALHPNAIRIELKGDKRQTQVMGVSRGGGLITIVEVDGFATQFSAQSKTLVITAKDIKGSIAFIANVVAYDDCNIATMTVNRSGKNDRAKLVLEIDHELRPTTLEYIQTIPWIHDVIYLPEVDV